jgi:hypothetical protein
VEGDAFGEEDEGVSLEVHLLVWTSLLHGHLLLAKRGRRQVLPPKEGKERAPTCDREPQQGVGVLNTKKKTKQKKYEPINLVHIFLSKIDCYKAMNTCIKKTKKLNSF